ncbi:hypothetical protein JCM8202_000877 [Rhodotorula sphaerocarpa]
MRVTSPHLAKLADLDVALPLRFVLLRPLSAALSSPAALVAADLPWHHPASRNGAGSGSAEASVRIYRLIDPAHHITPIEGLLRFPEVAKSYDTTLGGIAPFTDLWVPLRLARQVVAELGRLHELAQLLAWESRRAWTVEDREEGALLHNWRIASEHLASGDYSTRNMLSTPFFRIDLLPPGTEIRTLLPVRETIPSFDALAPEGPAVDPQFEVLLGKVVEWSVLEYERWSQQGQGFKLLSEDWPPLSAAAADPRQVPVTAPDVDDLEEDEEVQEQLRPSAPTPSAEAPSHEPDLVPLFLYTFLTSLVDLERLVPDPAASTTSPDFRAHLPSIAPLSRVAMLDLSHPGGLDAATLSSARLYLLDALSRLVLHHYHRAQLSGLDASRLDRAREEEALRAEQAKFGELQGRVRELERRVEGEARWKEEQLAVIEEEVERLATAATRACEGCRRREGFLGGGEWRLAAAAAAAAFAVGLVLGFGLAVNSAADLTNGTVSTGAYHNPSTGSQAKQAALGKMENLAPHGYQGRPAK